MLEQDDNVADNNEVDEVVNDVNTEEVQELNEEQQTEVAEEVIVTIDGEEDSPSSEDEEKENPWVKVREMSKQNKKLQKQLDEFKPKEPDASVLPEKPTLEGSDFDEEDYEAKLVAWVNQKAEHEKHKQKAEQEQQTQQEAWNKRANAYEEQKEELGFGDEIQQIVVDELSDTQQGIIVQHFSDSAKVVLALGKNPGILKDLAKITNPIDFALAVKKIEPSIKVTRRSPPPPETQLNVSRGSAGQDKELARLEAIADRTGDRTDVIAYRRKLKS